jgi:hypothetical protein
MRWIVGQVGDDMAVLVGGIALQQGQRLVIEPMHCVGTALRNAATWKCTWRTGDDEQSPLQVNIAIDEAAPMIVHVRVNGTPVISLPIPWAPLHGIGIPPRTSQEADQAIDEFRIRFCAAIDWVIEEWVRSIDSNNGADLAGIAAERRVESASATS